MKPFVTVILVLTVALMVGCTASRMRYDTLAELSPEQRRFANKLMANSFFDESVENGIISQRTVYPYHFVPDSARLNELGERDLQVLAAYYKDRLAVKKVIKNVKVYFDYDKADIREDAVPILDEAARVLRATTEADILITGHADVRGTEEYNQQLGARRADAVRRYLLSGGIESSRIWILSRGELDAVAPETDPQGMQNDRNAQFVVAEVEGYPSKLSVWRGNASEALYTARRMAVVKFLRKEGLGTDRITINDALPGGEGMASERVLLILNEQSIGGSTEGAVQ